MGGCASKACTRASIGNRTTDPAICALSVYVCVPSPSTAASSTRSPARDIPSARRADIRSARRANCPETITYSPLLKLDWRNTTSLAPTSIVWAAWFRRFPIAGGHRNNSSSGRFWSADPCPFFTSACIVPSPLIRCDAILVAIEVAAIESLTFRWFADVAIPARRISSCRMVRGPMEKSRDLIKARSFSLFVARPSPYRISARVSASGSLTSFTGSGGTHKTGTRERANRANAVPCGPGVSLARLTPATSMLG